MNLSCINNHSWHEDICELDNETQHIEQYVSSTMSMTKSCHVEQVYGREPCSTNLSKVHLWESSLKMPEIPQMQH